MTDFPSSVFVILIAVATLLFFWFNEHALAKLIQLLAVRLELMRVARRAVEKHKKGCEEYWRERVKVMPDEVSEGDIFINLSDLKTKAGEKEVVNG
jgi:hypothetical protein